MPRSRRLVLLALLGGFTALSTAGSPLSAQDQTPNRRDLIVVAKGSAFSPARIEVAQDDLVKITVRSEDVAHGFAIDEYRISKRVPAGGSVTFEFRADRAGTFPFYCNLTADTACKDMKGTLTVKAK